MRITPFVACALLLVSTASRAQVPADEPGPLEKNAKPITATNPVPKRLPVPVPDYPAAAAAVEARATVTLRATVDETGHVAEVRLIAISARGKKPQFSVNFTNAGLRDRTSVLALQLDAPAVALASSAIDALVQAAIDNVRGWSYDPPADAPISFAVALNLAPDMQHGVENAPGGGVPQGHGVTSPVRVGDDIKPPTKIHHVNPVYPKIAQGARVQGTVVIEAQIDRDGTVSHAQVLQSIPLLDEPALEAVTQWRFTPTLLNGAPVPVVMTVTVAFTLR